jgi:6-phosphogluconolactonase
MLSRCNRNLLIGLLTCGIAAGNALVCAEPAAGVENPAGRLVVYVGTYNGPKSKGIYEYDFDPASGAMTAVGEPAEITNSSFMAIHPNGKYLYSVIETENFRGKNSGGLKSFAIDPKSGQLTPLNEQSSEGAIPCHLVVDPTGQHVLVANYNGGTFTAVAIEPDGKLGPVEAVHHDHGSSVNRERQEAAHPHGVCFDPAGKFFLVADLGVDKLFVYRLETVSKDTAVRFEPAQPPFAAIAPGSGPRHVAFHPNGKILYLVNELGGTLMAFHYDAETGALHQFQTISTLPKGFTGKNTAAAVVVHPTGRYVYACNRGDDSVVAYSVDATSGTLTFVERVSSGGKTPRDCVIDPNGDWLLATNQGSDNVTVFKIDADSGRLKPTDKPIEIGAPGCVIFHRLNSANDSIKH